MKILYYLLKIWISSFIIFIFVSFLVPSKRPFTDGEIYINSKIYKNKIETKKPHLILENTENFKEMLYKVSYWLNKTDSIKKIVFIIPRYDVILYYFYLKQQKIIKNEDYQISYTNEVFDIQRIFLKYHETIGVFMEYVFDYLSYNINKIFRKVKF